MRVLLADLLEAARARRARPTGRASAMKLVELRHPERIGADRGQRARARARPRPLAPARRAGQSPRIRRASRGRGPGASTNVGCSWTVESSSTAGGAGLPASSAATHRLAARLIQPSSALRVDQPPATRASAAGVAPPRRGRARARAARSGGARCLRAAANTGALARPVDLDRARARSWRARASARHDGSTDRVLELGEQLRDPASRRARRRPARPTPRPVERLQAGRARRARARARPARPPIRIQLLASAVAAQLDVVARAPPRLRGRPLPRSPRERPLRSARGGRHRSGAAARHRPSRSARSRRGVLVERHAVARSIAGSRARPDARAASRPGPAGVGGEAEPPVAHRARARSTRQLARRRLARRRSRARAERIGDLRADGTPRADASAPAPAPGRGARARPAPRDPSAVPGSRAAAAAGRRRRGSAAPPRRGPARRRRNGGTSPAR